MSFVVAIDGPAGSGKGTVTKLVGKKEGLIIHVMHEDIFNSMHKI